MSQAIKRNISVIGLGYVGLPVAVAFGKKRKVIGFDINQKRINELKSGVEKTNEIDLSELKKVDIFFTSNKSELSRADFHIVTVPTPINDSKEPDLTPLILASKTIGEILKKGDIVVYESTVYPGVTEDECLPILEDTSGLKSNADFFVGYSPERINPGDKKHKFETIKKVVSAQNENTLEIIADVYASVVDAGIFKATSIKVAEAAKVIENTQRDLNIALMNELAILSKHMNIDTNDILETAGTKWNFLPFKPGLVGGHCIGVDPYYLTYKSRELGYFPKVILSGREINDGMGKFIADSLIDSLKKRNKITRNTVITILGITFKENISDIRNTKVIDIFKELGHQPLTIQIYDPYADNQEAQEQHGIDLIELNDLKKADALVLAVPHKEFIDGGWKFINKLMGPDGGIVYDVKCVLDKNDIPKNIHLIRL
jgi:UDP-N-acetyl-D-galactosamine dehydrogenase